MRLVSRTLAAAITAASLALPATPANAVGEGCAGFPSIPSAYVCIVTLNPAALLPGTSTGSIPVTVPAFCYVAGCTSDTTVNVPVPGATPGSGEVVVLYYNGQYYSLGSVSDVLGDAVGLAGAALGIALDVAGDVLDLVSDPPTTTELLVMLLGDDWYTIRDAVRCLAVGDC